MKTASFHHKQKMLCFSVPRPGGIAGRAEHSKPAASPSLLLLADSSPSSGQAVPQGTPRELCMGRLLCGEAGRPAMPSPCSECLSREA